MKYYLLLVILALASADINYQTLSNFQITQCINSNPWTGLNIYNYRSPIAILSSQCLAYGAFSLSMTSVNQVPFTADSVRGSLSIPYTGAVLSSDQFTWFSNTLLFRRRGEHRLYTANPTGDVTVDAAIADMEMQIIMSGANGITGVLSFLIKKLDTTSVAQNMVISQLNIIKEISSTYYTLDLAALSNSINNKLSQGLYLNMFTYNGTLTYGNCDKATWWIYGNHLYATAGNIAQFDAALVAAAAGTAATSVGTFTGVTFNPQYNAIGIPLSNARPYAMINNISPGFGGGAQYAARLCFTGYFDVYLNWNYGLWFGTVIITCFFILTLSTGDKPITDPDYKEEVKTIHPWVSLWKVGNELHTRKLRSAMILATMTMHALFSSVFYRVSNTPSEPSNIIVYAIYSMLISQGFLYMYGCILRQYYKAKSEFHKTKDEALNQKAQNLLFAYYSALFAMLAICWPFCVWNMDTLNAHGNPTPSNYWVASFFVGLALEWLFFDILWCVIAYYSNGFKNFIKHKGYMYDDLMHATYMDYIKMD